jgi:DNA ligase 1
MKKLEKLYKIDTTGKLREWTMVIEDACFYAIKGVVGGKLIEDKPRCCEAKNVGRSNETTPQEQAELEAQAKWQKKLDKDYALTPLEAQEQKFYSPMLAQKYEDRKNETPYPLYCQPKLDGIRCIVQRRDTTKELQSIDEVELVAKTRNGKVIDAVPHILESLRAFFISHPEAILDGELYNHDLKDNFNKITSLVRKQKPTRLESDTDASFEKKEKEFKERLKEGADTIQYWIYDAPQIGGLKENTNFFERYDQLNFSLPTKDFENNHPCLVVVHTAQVHSESQLDEMYALYVGEGYEGQIIRTDSPYENKRSKGLLKRKEFQDAEYRVIDIDEGNGNRIGTAKHLVLWCDNKKTRFNSNIKGSFEYLTEILENKNEYIGKQATIRFFQLTPDGIPRFPFAVGFRDYE